MKQGLKIRICILMLTMLIVLMNLTAQANVFLNPNDLRAKVVNCQNWVSLRESPSTSALRLCKVPLGAIVYVHTNAALEVDDEHGVAFIGVTYNGMEGWIAEPYLQSVSEEDLQPNNYESAQNNNSRFDLDQYEYRPVTEKGRGALVFQRTPRGSFMKNHKFYDGDWVFVNVNWRQKGYAIAYEDGDYGYVDASYINWQ